MFRLRHGAEGLRYAVKLADRDDSDPVLLRTLSASLWNKATTTPPPRGCSKKPRPSPPSRRSQALSTCISQSSPRVYSRLGDNVKAAEALAKVEDALADRDKHELTNDQVEEILAEPDRSDEKFGEIYLAAGQYDRARAAFERVTPRTRMMPRRLSAATRRSPIAR